MSPRIVLENHLSNGYCLHGSKAKLHCIEPRPAYCKSGRPDAEPTDVRVPIVMALFAGQGTGSYSGDGIMLTVTGDRTFSSGYVHVLSPHTFQNVCGEYVSYVSVIPVAIVPVDPSILWELLGLGNFDLRIPIPKPW